MNRSARRRAHVPRQRYEGMDEETTASSQRKRGPSSSYVVTARNGASVTRIREPHDNDVLSGRGGSINNHPGNKKFRDWVHERKNDYNLAANKAEKASVAREVIDLVKAQDPPGRFLTRDTNAPSIGPTWWVEISDNKANAKTSQALREGAPKIRADHKEELEERKRGGGGRHGSKRAAPVAAEPEPRPEQEEESHRTFQSSVEWPEPAPAPAAYPEPSEQEASMPPPPVVAMSNEMAIEALRTAAEAAKHGLGVPTDNKRSAILFNQPMAHPTKRARIMEPPSSSENETPPLMPMSGDSDSAPYMSLSSLQKADKMKRAHSLALSDINDADLGEEFINPFEDESSDHPVNYLEGPPSDNHSVGHMSFSPLPKLSSSDLSRKSSIGNGNKSSPMHKTRSSRSMISELSDLPDPSLPTPGSTDFNEGLKTVWGAVTSDITSLPEKEDDSARTHLYPFRGGSPLTRRVSPVKSKKARQMSADVKNWRQ